jgi:uncharacterized protein
MAVVDIDSHFEPTGNWLDEFPALKAKLPENFPTDDPRFTLGSVEMFAYFVTDDLLRGTPIEKRMPIERLVTPGMRVLFDPQRGPGVGYEGAEQSQPMRDVPRRLSWMDKQGIGVQNVISTDGATLARAVKDPELSMEALTAVNTWLTDHAAEAGGRLMVSANLRCDDLDWAIAELTRVRQRGSRTFLFSSEPAGDVPPNHPDYDRFWSAVTDLGMIPVIHVGLSPAIYHPAWANTDNPGLIRAISVLQPQQQALVFLNAMVLGGVFERHPTLTVVFAEHGMDWIVPAARRMDALASPGYSPLVLGEYNLPLAPSEYVRRNVRVTPLPVPHESPVEVLEALPEVPIFSSDYPHFEGSGDPAGHYAQVLAETPDPLRSSFLGGNLADCFARMGDPIAVPATAGGVTR